MVSVNVYDQIGFCLWEIQKQRISCSSEKARVEVEEFEFVKAKNGDKLAFRVENLERKTILAIAQMLTKNRHRLELEGKETWKQPQQRVHILTESL